jgi:hypothetical protein
VPKQELTKSSNQRQAIGARFRHSARTRNLQENQEQVHMFKVTLFATAAALVVTPVLAQQGRMALGEGEAVLISPDGAMYRSTVKVSDAKHQAAVAKGASEVSAGTVLYRHGGKLFTVRCTGTDIGAWEEGYPGTENRC